MVNQKNLIFGRDGSDGLAKPYKYNQGAMDVYIQDQTTQIVTSVLSQDLETLALAEPAIINSNNITIQAGHSVAAGDVISISQYPNFYQGIVLNVAVNTITLDTPLDKAFTTGATIIRGNLNLNVNGNVTPVIFHSKPPGNQQWDITQLVVYIIDDAAMDDTTLGGLAGGVSKGIVLRKRNAVYDNIGNAKCHGDLKALGCDVVYATKVGGGEYSMQSICQFGGQANAGVVIRVDGTRGEEVEVIVQDDLSAITRVNVVVVGHVVE
jgi:hypothetical protein